MRKLAFALGLTFAAPLAVLAATPAAAPAAAQPAAAQERYSVEDTEIGTLLDDSEAAAIIDKYVPGFSSSPDTGMARGMTLRQVQPYAQDAFTDKVLQSIDADFGKLAEQKTAQKKGK